MAATKEAPKKKAPTQETTVQK